MAKSYSSNELIAIARNYGWYHVRTAGSHYIMAHATRPGIVNIPHPRKDIPQGTARQILKTIGAL